MDGVNVSIKSTESEYRFIPHLLVVSANTTEVKLSQPSKARSSIEVTLLGIVMLVSDVQALKAQSPIEVTLLGIVMLVSDVQAAKVLPPIEVTPSGIVMLVNEHPMNAWSPIVVTVSGISNISDVQFQNILRTIVVMPSGSVTLSSAVQSLKMPLPIEITLEISMLTISSQYSNAKSPIEVTLSGILISFSAQ